MFRYFGSKHSSAAQVAQLATQGFSGTTAADAFGGLGTIGAVLKGNGFKVTTCDVLNLPNAFQHARIVCQTRPRFSRLRAATGLKTSQDILDYLDTRRAERSWLVSEFSTQRQFFTHDNAARIAGAWNAIRRWDEGLLLSESERKYLLASFLNSMDPCANTAGTYYAHLKHWHRKALKPFQMKWLPVQAGVAAGQALVGDALEVLKGKRFDLLYLDPPYNRRDYSRYYHLPESLASLKRPDTNPESASGVPMKMLDASPLIRKSAEASYLQELISSVEWRRLVVQYCEGSEIPMAELRKMLGRTGILKEFVLPALGYTTSAGARQHKHHVFIVDQARVKPRAPGRRNPSAARPS
nr:DNA adenine methylase [uncultured Albidiferax sp.]